MKNEKLFHFPMEMLRSKLKIGFREFFATSRPNFARAADVQSCMRLENNVPHIWKKETIFFACPNNSKVMILKHVCAIVTLIT